MQEQSTTTSPTAPTVVLHAASDRQQTAKTTDVNASEKKREGGLFLARIVPSDEGELLVAAMENWFQACSSDEPFSLELVGTHREQRFVLRATSSEQLNMLCKQLEAQYPQADIRHIAPADDPLLLRPGEQAAIAEFALQQETWMPIKTFSGKVLAEAGSDPLTAILADMSSIEPGCRIVSQLVLVRAKDDWLSTNIRKSVEHPLQQERDKAMVESKGLVNDTTEALKIVALMALAGGGFFAYRWYQQHLLLPLLGLGMLAFLSSIGFLCWKMRTSSHTIYDMKLVSEKMARSAFYTQLRVIAIGKEPHLPPHEQALHIQHLHTQWEEKKGQIHQTQKMRRQLCMQKRTILPHIKDTQQRNALMHQCDLQCQTFKEQIKHKRCALRDLKKKLQREQRQDKKRMHAHTALHEQARQQLRQQLHARVTSMETVYRQYSLASANGFLLKNIVYLRTSDPGAIHLPDPRHAFSYTRFQQFLHQGAYGKWILNSLELAGMFHLPQETADLPLVRRVSMKHLLFSPEIANQIKHCQAPMPPALMGYSCHRRYRVPVLLPFSVLFGHKFAVGMSRSGKTWLLQVLMRSAMQKVVDPGMPQPGVFAIDPHRDFAMDVLQLVPAERAHDVLLLDMTDIEHPVALNPLDASMGFTRDQAVSNLMGCFRLIWAEQWGPRMNYFLNSVCLLLYTLNERLVLAGLPEQQYTILDINPLLQYKDYANEVLSHLDQSETWHQELMVFWQSTYFNLKPDFKNEIIMPIISKIGIFSDNMQLRRIVGQPITKAPIHLAVSEGKIVICALSAKDMDDNAVNILGSTLINLLHRSFTLQQSIPLTQRRKVFVAIDELQNFSGAAYDAMLSESAKLGCAMMLTTQSLTRLNKIRDGLLEIILSTCQHLFTFRISAADAQIMETEFQEKITTKHIISQQNLHCYARLALPDMPIQLTSVALLPPGSWKSNPLQDQIIDAIQTASRAASLPIDEIDRRYAAHLKQFLDLSQSFNRVKREAKAARKTKNDRDQAEQRAADLHADMLTYSTARSSADSDIDEMDDTSDDEEAEIPGESSDPDPESVTVRKRRRHRRGKHGTKNQMDTELTQGEADEEGVEKKSTHFPNFSSGNSWQEAGKERGEREKG